MSAGEYLKRADALQARFRGVLDAAPDAIVIVDQSGRIAFANTGTERVFGFARAELLGEPIEILVPLRFHGQHPGHRHEFFASPGTRPMGSGLELSGRRKGGEEFPVEISLSPLDVDGVVMAMAAIRDVTLRKKGEAKFRGLLEAAPDAMIIVNADGVITLVNSQVEFLFGYGREELLGKPAEVLLPSSFASIHSRHRDGYFADPHRRPMGGGLSLSGRRKDGSEFPVEISLSPVETEDGMLVTAAVRDISDRLKAQDALQLANRELESFTYSVSHDLRAPIRQIDGFSRILMEEAFESLSPDARHYLERIQEGAQHMGRLVDALLHLASVGRQGVHLRPVAMDTVVREVLLDLEPESAGRKVRWTIDPLPTADADHGLMRAVFTNLIGNALKYTRTRDEAHIHVGAQEANGRMAFFVRDNGVGFDMKYADKLFGVFQRLHRREDFEGTGVGLATVQRIIHKHGGTIWPESALDQGATFLFTLGADAAAGRAA